MLKWIVGICVFICAAFIAEICRELNTFRLKHYSIISSDWKNPDGNEEKIIFLSDLHNKEYGKKNKKLIEAIRNEQPDLILIGGDIPVGRPGKTLERALEFVRSMCEICPVYYANGNHEQRMKEDPKKYGNAYVKYRRALKKAGVHMLENESIIPGGKARNICISGLELPMYTYERFKKNKVSVHMIQKKLGKTKKDCYHILLAHNPVYADVYKAWGADLILCGHQHGGLICLPGGKAVFTPQFELFPRYNGEMTVDGDSIVVVSRGLGTHTINVRLFNPAEVIVLHMKSTEVL